MHLSQVWARKARDSGMVRPERPCLLHTQASPGATALLTAVHDPRSPCERSPWPWCLVIPLETLRETLVDGPVEDGKVSALASARRAK